MNGNVVTRPDRTLLGRIVADGDDQVKSRSIGPEVVKEHLAQDRAGGVART